MQIDHVVTHGPWTLCETEQSLVTQVYWKLAWTAWDNPAPNAQLSCTGNRG
jgi:hypothetical protein